MENWLDKKKKEPTVGNGLVVSYLFVEKPTRPWLYIGQEMLRSCCETIGPGGTRLYVNNCFRISLLLKS